MNLAIYAIPPPPEKKLMTPVYYLTPQPKLKYNRARHNVNTLPVFVMGSPCKMACMGRRHRLSCQA
jgi:hypothetical protein